MDRKVRDGSRRDQRGAAVVEFAIAAQVLMLVVLGIIVLGVALGKRQVLTQSAAEGARAGVPVPYSSASTGTLYEIARQQVNRSLGSVSRPCPASPSPGAGVFGNLDADGVRCTMALFDCAAGPGADDPADHDDCLEVRVEVRTRQNSFLPTAPLVDRFLPDTMSASSVSRLDGWTATP